MCPFPVEIIFPERYHYLLRVSRSRKWYRSAWPTADRVSQRWLQRYPSPHDTDVPPPRRVVRSVSPALEPEWTFMTASA